MDAHAGGELMGAKKKTPERKRLVCENSPEVDADLRQIATAEAMKTSQLVRLVLARFVQDYQAAESEGERIQLIRM